MQKIAVLEGVRGFVALYVVIFHVFYGSIVAKTSPVGFLIGFGREAVMVFFLLSGFVIHHSVSNRKQSFRQYFIRRFLRIYPIFVLSLVVSYFSYCLVLEKWMPIPYVEAIGNLLMLQDYSGVKPGIWFNTFLGNTPLWSLSYEWWFYMLFYSIHVRVKQSKQFLFVCCLSFAGFFGYWIVPNQICLYLMYFILWWTGVEIAKVYGTGDHPCWKNLRHVVVVLTLFVVMQFLGVLLNRYLHPGALLLAEHPVLELRHFAAALTIALFTLAPLKRAAPLTKLLEKFAFLAPISYALYVLHYPILLIWEKYKPLTNLGVASTVTLTVCMLGCFILSWIAEFPYQRAMVRGVRHIEGTLFGPSDHNFEPRKKTVPS